MDLSRTTEDWKTLARGESERLSRWLAARGFENRRIFCLITIMAGSGVYGVTIGLWHGPLMASYVGIKLPLIVFVTLGLNALINGQLAQLLGSRLTLRQTTDSLLMAFAVFSLIVGSLSPVTVFLVWNAPPPDAPEAGPMHRQLLVIHTLLIAFAGMIATHRLHGIVARFCHHRSAASRTLFAWLVGNLFAGAQVSFLFRPIFGTPGLKIEFLRPDAFRGNFYESLWWAITHLSE